MASIITADTGAVSGTAGLKQSADSSGVLALATGTGTTAVTIDASQNVGVGTASPGTYGKFAVLNSAATSTTQFANSNIWAISNASNADSNISISNGVDHSAKIGIYNGANLYFALDGSEKARIDASGNLMVGTTSGVAKVNTSTLGSSQAGLNVYDTATGTTAYACVNFIRNGSAVGYISTTNAITSYVSLSDYRLKENIAPMTGALDVVQKLKPCTYSWKVDGSDGQGFIAHELQAVVPDCVTGEKDAVDKDGNPVYQGIDTSFLVATLTAAIQEQQALITTLTERITALEAK